MAPRRLRRSLRNWSSRPPNAFSVFARRLRAYVVAVTPPPTQYAMAGDVSIAYKVMGDRPRDLIVVPGYLGHVELM